ncbi:4466_t:CDS:2 [Rhizophagus irregularis]|nr:4466_t:CDS:2 [Rhizophagus irregularis]
MSSIKSKVDKKCKIENKVSSTPTINKNNEKLMVDKNNKNKKVIENSKSEIDDIFASAKNKKVSTDPQLQELSTASSSSSLSSSTIKQKVEEFVFKVPAIPDKSQATKRKLKLNDDNGFSDTRGTKSRKTTEDGLPIFDIKELNVGNGEGNFSRTCLN